MGGTRASELAGLAQQLDRQRLAPAARRGVMPTRKEDIASAKAKSTWQPDSEATCCTKCGEKFTLLRRRHHCRLCGGIFCNSCSEARANKNFDGVILAKPQRACMDCYAELRRKPVGWGSQAASGKAPSKEPEPASDHESDASEESDADSSVEVQTDSRDRQRGGAKVRSV